ncbi:alpha/beta hydrolase [Corynebacterium sp. H130]|uniref:alpha/beta hydrolase n=1 Tax=Corynebacterium sp. H130 TaxID=3133444 RepID=UPI0030B2DB1B
MHTSHISHTRNKWMRVIVAAITALTLAFMVTPAAKADNRGWLRPGCSWAPQGYYIQACEVWSPSNNRNMLVYIQPASAGGNGGLYLLDGAQVGARDSNWASYSTTPADYVNENVTLVMPAGGAGQFYADWAAPATSSLSSGPQRPMWESFLAYELPGYLQEHFGVSPNRNAIAGVSMGAIPALTLAAHHPDQFRQAHAISGFIDPAMATHVGMIAGFSVAMLLHSGAFIWDWWSWNPLEASARALHADPVANAHKLRDGGVDVHVWSGNSHPGAGESYPGSLGPDAISIHGETLINMSTESFVNKARNQGLNVHRHFGAGLHTWQPWGRYMNDHKGDVLWAIG